MIASFRATCDRAYWRGWHMAHRVRFWWGQRWFRRNRERLRNVAAWAVAHQIKGGIHDSRSILNGEADRRIQEAAMGRV